MSASASEQSIDNIVGQHVPSAAEIYLQLVSDDNDELYFQPVGDIDDTYLKPIDNSSDNGGNSEYLEPIRNDDEVYNFQPIADNNDCENYFQPLGDTDEHNMQLSNDTAATVSNRLSNTNGTSSSTKLQNVDHDLTAWSENTAQASSGRASILYTVEQVS